MTCQRCEGLLAYVDQLRAQVEALSEELRQRDEQNAAQHQLTLAMARRAKR